MLSLDCYIFKVSALIATITVDKDIKIAPTAGDSKIHQGASTPAANGNATIL